MKVSFFLANLVRDFLEEKIRPIEDRREREKAKLQNPQSSQEVKEEAQNKLRELDIEIMKNQFSLELIAREIYFLGEIEKNNM
mmetsp:Transcript_33500/g.51448  ORF Transcript_33500/g.51448 Transcript_33500/m.51448 type:complete len:83 (-) Transcript_33500:4718-4966(-)